MLGLDGSYTLVAPAMAISVIDVVPEEYSSLTFGVSSGHVGTRPEVSEVTTTNK